MGIARRRTVITQITPTEYNEIYFVQGVIFLDIKLLSENCAKITVNSDECECIGIDYSSFTPDNDTARIFLASVLARLERIGMLSARSDKITAEVFENKDGSMVIYISGEGVRKIQSKESNAKYAKLFKSPDEVIAYFKSGYHCKSSELFSYRSGYLLLSGEPISENELSTIEIAKIEEYGKLLSDTPEKLLCDI